METLHIAYVPHHVSCLFHSLGSYCMHLEKELMQIYRTSVCVFVCVYIFFIFLLLLFLEISYDWYLI